MYPQGSSRSNSCPLLRKGTTQQFCFIFAKATLTCASLNRNLLFFGSHWHSQFSSFWHLNSINMLFTPSSGLLMKNIKIKPNILAYMQHLKVIVWQLLVGFGSAEVTNLDKWCGVLFLCFFLKTREHNLILAFWNINSINTCKCTLQPWHICVPDLVLPEINLLVTSFS